MHSNLSRRRLLTAAGAAIGAAAVGGSAKGAEKRPAGFTYCLNTGTIRGQKLSIDKEIEIAAKAGYASIEPWVDGINRYKDAGGSLKDLKKKASDLGITVESAISFPSWIVDDDAQRAKGFEQVGLVNVGLIAHRHEFAEADLLCDGPVEYGGSERAGLR